MFSETFFFFYSFIGSFIVCSLKVDEHLMVLDARTSLMKRS